MLLVERLRKFRDSKDQYWDAWEVRNWLYREIEASLVAQRVRRDRPISRKSSRSEAEQLLGALKQVFRVIEDVERQLSAV